MAMNQTPAPRIPLRYNVEYRKTYSRRGDQGVLRNISLTGAFLEASEADLAKNDKVLLNMMVGGRERKLSCRVIWVGPRGAGLQFLHFNNRDIQLVDDLMYFTENAREKRLSVLETIFKKVS